jgi:hypothetical protein
MYDIDIWKIISQFIHRKKDRQNARSALELNLYQAKSAIKACVRCKLTEIGGKNGLAEEL